MHESQQASINPTAEVTQESLSILKKKSSSKRNLVLGIGVGVVILLLGGAWFGRGLVVAATVNGIPISRFSVIQELEKQSGKAALESLVTKRLIEDELRGKGITISKDQVDREIAQIESQVVSQGGTLEDALKLQGMTIAQLRERIEFQKKVEALLGEKIAISDAEVETYIAESKIDLPKDQEPAAAKAVLKEQLKQQKFQQEAPQWLSELTAKANIKYYITY